MERLWWPFTFQLFSRDDCFSSVTEEIVDVSQLAAIIIFSLQWHKGFPFFTCHVGVFQMLYPRGRFQMFYFKNEALNQNKEDNDI